MLKEASIMSEYEYFLAYSKIFASWGSISGYIGQIDLYMVNINFFSVFAMDERSVRAGFTACLLHKTDNTK